MLPPDSHDQASTNLRLSSVLPRTTPQTCTARHRRGVPRDASRPSRSRSRSPHTAYHQRRAQARQSANANTPQRVIESAHSVITLHTGPADVAASETESESALHRSCRTTTSIGTVVLAGANPSWGGGERTRMPAHSLRNRRCRSDQRPNARRAHAVLPPRGYTYSVETCSQNVGSLRRTTSDSSR